jgi:hypothetical protein
MNRKEVVLLALAVVLLAPNMASGSGVGDICVYLNGGADIVYTDQANTLEIWIANDQLLGSMSFGLTIYWDPAVTITWNMSHGSAPPLDEHGRAVGAWDLTGLLNVNDFDNISPDNIGVGGAAIMLGLPSGPSEFCYSLEFDASATGIISDGFSVEPYFYPRLSTGCLQSREELSRILQITAGTQ